MNLSGSTGISASFHNGRVTISNVGDSRAILGYQDGSGNSGSGSGNDKDAHSTLLAVPLSQDQTPWRKDERERIRRCGGRVMTLDQVEGKEEVNVGGDAGGDASADDEGDRKLGEEGDIDVKGDPPRVCKFIVIFVLGRD